MLNKDMQSIKDWATEGLDNPDINAKNDALARILCYVVGLGAMRELKLAEDHKTAEAWDNWRDSLVRQPKSDTPDKA